MSETWKSVLLLVQRGEVRVSDHGYDEMAADGLCVKDAVVSIAEGAVLED